MKIQNDTGVTYAANTNRYSNTQNAGSKTGRTYKNAHEYKNYLTQKYDCLRSKDYSVNINSSLLSEAMGDEKTKQWLEYNLSLIPKTIEQSEAYVAARGAKILSYSITINGYDSMSSVMCTQDEADPRTEKARKELEERLEKRKAEKKEPKKSRLAVLPHELLSSVVLGELYIGSIGCFLASLIRSKSQRRFLLSMFVAHASYNLT